jgi:hypothetical protein
MAMDSLTLGLLYKIDFNDEHNNSTIATLRELADLHNIYLNTFSKYRKKFNIEFRIITYLEASIYRL